MRISFDRHTKKYQLHPKLTYLELASLLPVEAACAAIDLPDYYKDASYQLIDGELYCRSTKWFYFDTSVRRWHQEDPPTV